MLLLLRLNVYDQATVYTHDTAKSKLVSSSGKFCDEVHRVL